MRKSGAGGQGLGETIAVLYTVEDIRNVVLGSVFGWVDARHGEGLGVQRDGELDVANAAVLIDERLVPAEVMLLLFCLRAHERVIVPSSLPLNEAD